MQLRKNFENRSIFGNDTDKILWLTFWATLYIRGVKDVKLDNSHKCFAFFVAVYLRSNLDRVWLLIQVKSENQVCEVLLKWFERRRASGNTVTEPRLYLSRIRWSGVDAEYVRTTVLHHAAIKQSQEAISFLCRVIAFQKTGVQSDGLRTSHRLSTKLERCMLAIVSGASSPLVSTMTAVSAQLTSSIEPRFGGDLPFSGTPLEAAAAVVDSTLYVVGVGADNDQIWGYGPSRGWRRCCGGWGGLVVGRRRHCAVAVSGQHIYCVAGYCPRDRSLVSYVERFDIDDNRDVVVDGTAATMPHPVLSAAAAAYNCDVYVFGGVNGENETVHAIQVQCIRS